VLSLDWDRRGRVTPAGLFWRCVTVSENRYPLFRITYLSASQEAWPEAEPAMSKSLARAAVEAPEGGRAPQADECADCVHSSARRAAATEASADGDVC
jgi:hypothetical protein